MTDSQSPFGAAMQARLRDVYGQTDGAPIPGGCAKCSARQELEPVEVGHWRVHVYHQPACPLYQSLRSH